MGSLGPITDTLPEVPATFDVLTDTRPDDTTLPPFMVSTTRGFLPRAHPVVDLPEDFAELTRILESMPIVRADGTPGLLAEGKLGETVDKTLPDLSAAVEKHAANLPLQNALYRDYSFLASAYLLEPCHLRFLKNEPYGLGRSKLPRQISVPLSICAKISGFKPFMEYAGSYALYNYKTVDPSGPEGGMRYEDLRLIRAFEKGLDQNSSEAGFVLVHVEMVKHSGGLVSGALQALEGVEKQDRECFEEGMCKVVEAMQRVNAVMERMWAKSKPNEYTSFRTFIMGITSQSMFPNGVVYEGVSEEPLSFRGESGANDSMIPLLDNLLTLSLPSTPLTTILQDFRSYRPGNHRTFLNWVSHRSLTLSLKTFALSPSHPTSNLWYLRALNQVREFRWRHWCFTREYILKRTSHPTATGGSPIVKWLPNQLTAVLEAMAQVGGAMGWEIQADGEEVSVVRRNGKEEMLEGKQIREVEEVMGVVAKQKRELEREVRKWCEERGEK